MRLFLASNTQTGVLKAVVISGCFALVTMAKPALAETQGMLIPGQSDYSKAVDECKKAGGMPEAEACKEKKDLSPTCSSAKQSFESKQKEWEEACSKAGLSNPIEKCYDYAKECDKASNNVAILISDNMMVDDEEYDDQEIDCSMFESARCPSLLQSTAKELNEQLKEAKEDRDKARGDLRKATEKSADFSEDEMKKYNELMKALEDARVKENQLVQLMAEKLQGSDDAKSEQLRNVRNELAKIEGEYLKLRSQLRAADAKMIEIRGKEIQRCSTDGQREYQERMKEIRQRRVVGENAVASTNELIKFKKAKKTLEKYYTKKCMSSEITTQNLVMAEAQMLAARKALEDESKLLDQNRANLLKSVEEIVQSMDKSKQLLVEKIRQELQDQKRATAMLQQQFASMGQVRQQRKQAVDEELQDAEKKVKEAERTVKSLKMRLKIANQGMCTDGTEGSDAKKKTSGPGPSMASTKDRETLRGYINTALSSFKARNSGCENALKACGTYQCDTYEATDGIQKTTGGKSGSGGSSGSGSGTGRSGRSSGSGQTGAEGSSK